MTDISGLYIKYRSDYRSYEPPQRHRFDSWRSTCVWPPNWIEAVLREDIATIGDDHDEFETTLRSKISPVEPDILTLTYGDEEYWNGFLIQDHFFPDNDSVEITQYRRVLKRVEQTTSRLGTLAHETVETLSHDPSKQPKELQEHSMGGDESIAFQ